MKKIFLFIDSLASGGAQRQIVGLAQLLHKKKYDVRVVTYFDMPFYADELDKYGIKREVIKGASKSWKRIFCVWNYFRHEQPDVVISYLDTPSIIACICKLFGGKWKLIVSERNTTQQLTTRERIKFWLYRFADHIAPNSFSQEHFIAENYSDLSKKVTTITNFVDTDYFSPAEVTKSLIDVRNIICVGRIYVQKNILRFLDAVAKVRDRGYKFHVSWYGKSFPEYYDKCVKKTQQLQLQSVFEFLKPDNNIRDRYREADVFCLPSIYEGFPNVLCEAMSCGLPVLCSAVCDNPNITKHGANGFLFNPLNVDEMADAMEKMFSLPADELNRMGDVSRGLSVDLFTSENFVQKYIKLIEK